MNHEHPGPAARDPDSHEKFKELSALAFSGTLTADERVELEDHLKTCDECRAIHHQYRLLATVGMPFLAATYGHPEEQDWDDSDTREALLARVSESEPIVNDLRARDFRSKDVRDHAAQSSMFPRATFSHLWSSPARAWMAGVSATCVLIAVASVAYHLGSVDHNQIFVAWDPSQQRIQDALAKKERTDDLLRAQTEKIAQAQEQAAREQQEIIRLRTALHTLEDRTRELAAAKDKSEGQLVQVTQQRDNLVSQLHQAEESYQKTQVELAGVRAEHDQSTSQTAALEARISELSAANQELERKMGDDERFLASDRDIRELMGARKLYIADVFDVDSGSRARKPFGRVFYTQNKSLIFYAFDLDREPGVKNASSFQVWGQKDSELNEKAHAMNLGILYMDNESSRRWVLRLDDPKEVAEIDAVFVTVEPHGGSPKPTGKPLLYALLRKEANHP